jgi:DNA-directed RNA polymerase subunit RPC12/RpoP
MTAGFRVQCPDCGHKFGGAVAWCRIGPGSLLEQHNRGMLFCPRCYLELTFPKVIERKVWKRWYRDFTADLQGRSPFLVAVAGQIDACVASAGWYTSTEVRLTGIKCPRCERPMEPGRDTDARLVCPRCGGRSTVLTKFDSHICGLQSAPDGFT